MRRRSRRPLDWENPDFYDEAKLDAEMRRVFDICHTCRRCFNLCDSFPRLFDLIDESKNGELDTVASSDFKKVVDACTLCDMCFMTKCPYVPPHEFDLDFPHLMLRYRAVETKKHGAPFADRSLAETDRNGRLGVMASGLANWATDLHNKTMRGIAKSASSDSHPDAALPKFAPKSLETLAKENPPGATKRRPRRRARRCSMRPAYGDYNDPSIGLAALTVLAKNGVETKVVHPHCCGMPKLEQGLIGEVAEAAKIVAAALAPYIDRGL